MRSARGANEVEHIKYLRLNLRYIPEIKYMI